jgi:hypothetical protein
MKSWESRGTKDTWTVCSCHSTHGKQSQQLWMSRRTRGCGLPSDTKTGATQPWQCLGGDQGSEWPAHWRKGCDCSLILRLGQAVSHQVLGQDIQHGLPGQQPSS